MPQATEEQRKRWGGELGIGEDKAIKFLEDAGYILSRDWRWFLPNPNHTPTPNEISAVQFLIDEWDFGGIWTEAKP